MLYTVDRHTNNSQTKSIGKYSINDSEQGNAAEMRQVNPLMQKAKRRGSGKQIQPQVYHVLSYKDLVSSRCSE
jgi:hypothetical protein